MSAAAKLGDPPPGSFLGRLNGALAMGLAAFLSAEAHVSVETIARIADGTIEPDDDLARRLGAALDRGAGERHRLIAPIAHDAASALDLPIIGLGPYVCRQGGTLTLTFHHDGRPTCFAISDAHALRAARDILIILLEREG